MDAQPDRGFTLFEVVLAIGLGLIVIAGVGVGYTYVKKSAIIDNQRKDVEQIKSFVEQAISGQEADRTARAMPWVIAGYYALPQWAGLQSPEPPEELPRGVEEGQLAGIVASPSPSASVTPAVCTTSMPPCITREQLLQLAKSLPSLNNDPYSGATRTACPATGSNSCMWSPSTNSSKTNSSLSGTLTSSNKLRDITSVPGSGKSGSTVAYLNFAAYSTSVTISMADGTTQQFWGYMILETDENDSIVAAQGGANPG